MKAKRILSVLLAAMLTAGAMAGCSSNQSGGESSASQGGDSSVQESVAATEKTDVDLWYYWETVKHQEALDDLITKYNDGQESVTVTAKYVPFADFKKQLSIGASAAELPDLVIIDSPDHAAYASMGIFADITGKFDTSNYYQGPVDSCTIDRKLYGVPADVN